MHKIRNMQQHIKIYKNAKHGKQTEKYKHMRKKNQHDKNNQKHIKQQQIQSM